MFTVQLVISVNFSTYITAIHERNILANLLLVNTKQQQRKTYKMHHKLYDLLTSLLISIMWVDPQPNPDHKLQLSNSLCICQLDFLLKFHLGIINKNFGCEKNISAIFNSSTREKKIQRKRKILYGIGCQ